MAHISLYLNDCWWNSPSLKQRTSNQNAPFIPFYRLGDRIYILSLKALLGKALGWEPGGISESATSLT